MVSTMTGIDSAGSEERRANGAASVGQLCASASENVNGWLGWFECEASL
jgi:hypothetical protein